jgi:hypothetical protein
MMNTDLKLPITDRSVSGRKSYLDKNRIAIELTLYEALEVFSEKDISRVFSSQEDAIKKIVDMFVEPHFNCSYFDKADLTIFSQLHFWMKYKTKGKYSASRVSLKGSLVKEACQENDNTTTIINDLAKSLNEFNNKVAADLIKYWLLANVKLLDALSADIEVSTLNISDLEIDTSNTTKTRYKADACFRFCYHYLSVSNVLCDSYKELYEKKFLTKGDNKPQYIYRFMNIESHDVKHRIRKYIEKIIDFHVENKSSYSDFDRRLLKPIAKKTLLSHYDFDESSEELYSNKIKSLSKMSELA